MRHDYFRSGDRPTVLPRCDLAATLRDAGVPEEHFAAVAGLLFLSSGVDFDGAGRWTLPAHAGAPEVRVDVTAWATRPHADGQGVTWSRGDLSVTERLVCGGAWKVRTARVGDAVAAWTEH